MRLVRVDWRGEDEVRRVGLTVDSATKNEGVVKRTAREGVDKREERDERRVV